MKLETQNTTMTVGEDDISFVESQHLGCEALDIRPEDEDYVIVFQLNKNGSPWITISEDNELVIHVRGASEPFFMVLHTAEWD